MKIKLADLKDVTLRVILKTGYTTEEAQIMLEVLLYAQLRGNNQGVVKLTGAGMPRHPAAQAIQTERETKLSALLNGNQTQGMVVMTRVMEMVIHKAQEHGFGMVGTHNTASPTGAIGYYADKMARQGLIGWVFAGTPPYVAPFGSYQALLGTNPLAIGLPTESDPLVLDMTTAAMAYYGLVEAKVGGRSIAADVAYDKHGNSTTDPAAALEGALRTFDRGHRSTGLSLIVEALTGPLVGAAFAGLGEPSNWGNLMLAIDPELLTDRASFQRQMSELVERIRGAKKLAGVERIFVPGERGNRRTAEALSSGEVEIDEKLWEALRAVLA